MNNDLSTPVSLARFASNQLSHAAGPLEMMVKNRRGEVGVTLRLSDAAGDEVSGTKLTNKVLEWAMPVELGRAAAEDDAME